MTHGPSHPNYTGDSTVIWSENLSFPVAVHDDGSAALELVQIKGYVQLMPFFGGVERTRSEAECPKEVFLNLELNDRYWRLSLPIGANFDHPFANPFGPDSPPLEPVEFALTLVVVVVEFVTVFIFFRI